MFRQDKNSFGVGLCIDVKENITSKQLNLHLDKENEAIYLKINIRLRKWLIVGLYRSPYPKQFLVFRKYVEKSFKICR